MANIREWLEEAEKFHGEQIEAVVVGVHDDRKFGSDDQPRKDEHVVLRREAGLAKVDEEYDNGYGGADCYPVFAWTASRVFFVTEYDGATGIAYVPRNPIACEPMFDGRDLAFDALERIRRERSAA